MYGLLEPGYNYLKIWNLRVQKKKKKKIEKIAFKVLSNAYY